MCGRVAAMTASPEPDPAETDRIRTEVEAWRQRMLKGPGAWDRATRGVQDRINQATPEKVHGVITAAIEQMTRAILFGAAVAVARPPEATGLAEREAMVRKRIDFYRNTASVEGGVAGAGGFVLAAADFPALMAIKARLLFEVSGLYGWGGGEARERLFLLNIFELAFSSARHRPEAMRKLDDWLAGRNQPERIEDFDWRRFQQEYRDFIDLAKLAQMLPVVGAPVGAVVNWRLVERLGEAAVMACRMRWLGPAAPGMESGAEPPISAP